MNRFDTNQITGLLRDLIALHTFSTTKLRRKFLNQRALSKTFFRYDHNRIALRFYLHCDNFIAIGKVHTDHTHCGTACGSYVCFFKTDTLSIFCKHKDIFVVISNLNLDQLVIISKTDRCKSRFTDILIILDWSFLYNTFSCCHEKIFLVFIFLNRNHCRNLFFRLEWQDIHDRSATGSTACLWNLICLDAVYTSHVGKEHQIMMGCGHEHLNNIIILNGFHSLNAFTTTILGFEIIGAHTLDISHFCHSDYRICLRN